MITQKTLSNFYHEFGTLIRAGVNILQALRSLSNSTSHFQLKKIIRGVRSEIEKGASLTKAMGIYSNVFSPLQLRIVEIGEITGKLDKSLFKIGDNLERNYRLQTKLITGFLYPVLLLHAAIFIPALPALVLEGFLPFLKIVATKIILLYGIALIVVLIVKISNRIEGLKKIFQYILSYLPIIGSFTKRLSIIRFMGNLSALHGAGENMVEAVSLSAEGCGSTPLANSILKILPEIERGGNLTSAFSKLRFFPSMAIEMLSTGEESGRIDDMLDKVAEYYEIEHETIVKRLVILLPVLVYFAVALYIASIIISSYMGYFGQMDSLF